MANSHASALSISAVQDELKDIELACPSQHEKLVEKFLNSVQHLAQTHFSQAGIDRVAVLVLLAQVRDEVSCFRGDKAVLKEYLVSSAHFYLTTKLTLSGFGRQMQKPASTI